MDYFMLGFVCCLIGGLLGVRHAIRSAKTWKI